MGLQTDDINISTECAMASQRLASSLSANEGDELLKLLDRERHFQQPPAVWAPFDALLLGAGCDRSHSRDRMSLLLALRVEQSKRRRLEIEESKTRLRVLNAEPSWGSGGRNSQKTR